jgi:hypothetical protein
MAMTFLNMQDNVLGQIGDATPATRTRVKRWINDARNMIWEQVPGIYKETSAYFTTTAAYTTGTVAVAEGGTVVTGTGTAWDTTWGTRFIQIGGTDPYYKVSAIASTTSLTISEAYAGSAQTTGAHKLHTYLWAGASDIGDLLAVYVELDEITEALPLLDRFDFLHENPQPLEIDTDTPEVAWLAEKNSSGVHEIGIWPVPSAKTVVRYRYSKEPTELTTNTDTMGIPGGDPAILAHTLVAAHSYRGDLQKVGFWNQRYEVELDRLNITVDRSSGKSWRLRDQSNAAQTAILANMGSKFPRHG